MTAVDSTSELRAALTVLREHDAAAWARAGRATSGRSRSASEASAGPSPTGFAASGGGFAYAVANHELAEVGFGPEAEGVVINGLVGKAFISYGWPPEVEFPLLATAYDR